MTCNAKKAAFSAWLICGCNSIMGISDRPFETNSGPSQTAGNAGQAGVTSRGGASVLRAGSASTADEAGSPANGILVVGTTITAGANAVVSQTGGVAGAEPASAGGVNVPLIAGAAGDVGAGGSSVVVSSSGAPASAGSAGIACLPACVAPQQCSNGNCVDCLSTAAAMCIDNTPATCVNGRWVKQDTCSGSKPACSQGQCGVAILTGGIVTVGSPVLTSTSGLRLVQHGLEYMPAVCGNVPSMNKTVCVSGGIRP